MRVSKLLKILGVLLLTTQTFSAFAQIGYVENLLKPQMRVIVKPSMNAKVVVGDLVCIKTDRLEMLDCGRIYKITMPHSFHLQLYNRAKFEKIETGFPVFHNVVDSILNEEIAEPEVPNQTLFTEPKVETRGVWRLGLDFEASVPEVQYQKTDYNFESSQFVGGEIGKEVPLGIGGFVSIPVHGFSVELGGSVKSFPDVNQDTGFESQTSQLFIEQNFHQREWQIWSLFEFLRVGIGQEIFLITSAGLSIDWVEFLVDFTEHQGQSAANQKSLGSYSLEGYFLSAKLAVGFEAFPWSSVGFRARVLGNFPFGLNRTKSSGSLDESLNQTTEDYEKSLGLQLRKVTVAASFGVILRI